MRGRLYCSKESCQFAKLSVQQCTLRSNYLGMFNLGTHLCTLMIAGLGKRSYVKPPPAGGGGKLVHQAGYFLEFCSAQKNLRTRKNLNRKKNPFLG